jgi:hypothetical protein
MIFSDGECPSCDSANLHLNTADLLECPNCHFVCANTDGVVATVMPFKGKDRFRFEDCRMPMLQGIAFAKSDSGSVLPDLGAIFRSREDLREYLRELPTEGFGATEGEHLFVDFQSAFKEFFLGCAPEELRLAWSSSRHRTVFYTQRAMPAVARQLGLVHGAEEFHVDFVMSMPGLRGHDVPRIYIESENVYASASHEIRKLCSVNSPLRCLLTVTDADLSSKAPSSAYKHLREWQSIVRSHHEQNPDFKGVIAVIIGQRPEQALEFLACAFHSTGDLLRPLTRLLLRDLT